MSMTFEHITLGQRVLFGSGEAAANLAAVTIGKTNTAWGAFYRRLSARIGKAKADDIMRKLGIAENRRVQVLDHLPDQR